MTPEQKELKIEAYAAWLDDPNRKFELTVAQHPDGWAETPIEGRDWGYEKLLIRLAPTLPTEIPWHNPKGVWEDKLPMGRRFLLKDERQQNEGGTKFNSEIWQWDDNLCGWDKTPWIGKNPEKTYCVPWPLPAKYAHLEEAKEFAARSAFAAQRLSHSEKLIYRGEEWNNDGNECVYLVHTTQFGVRRVCGVPEGGKNRYYAEIIRDETPEDVAKRLLLEVPQKEGYGPWEFLGLGPVEFSSADCATLLFVTTAEKPEWKNGYKLNGRSQASFYAFARKLEPELVPYTMETFPIPAMVRRAEYAGHATPFNVVETLSMGVLLSDNCGDAEIVRFVNWTALFDRYVITTDAGQTWRKCGREAR